MLMDEQNQVKPSDGGVAVGAYLRYLREAQGISVRDVADKIDTNQAQVWRIEHWKSDTRSSLLFKFIRTVNGSGDDVEMLMNNPGATAADGETIAKMRLKLNK